MKRERYKIKVKPHKKRKRWLINPRERVHGQKGYKRSRARRKWEREKAYED